MATSLFPSSEPQQAGFNFPQPLSEKYRPRAIAEFAGLEKPKKICSKLAANPFDSAWIFYGPSGTGKTTLAMALAMAIPAEIHHIPSQDCNLEKIERVRRTCQYVPMEGCKYHLVLVDEADQMTPAAQLALLSKLDSTDAAPFTIWIFTCNDTTRLQDRFMSRCRMIEFSSYGISKEVTALLEKIWIAETGGAGDRPNFARICKEANNNVRAALMTLETEIMAS